MEASEAADPRDDWDPLHEWSSPDLHWTTANVSENLPGVPTALTWTVWRPAVERSIREAGYALGVYTKSERRAPTRLDECYFRIFFGHFAWQVESLIPFGDRMPGTSGRDVTQTVLGDVPDDINYRPTKRRYPIIAWRMPWTFCVVPWLVRREQRQTEAWYHERLARIPSLNCAEAIAAFDEAAEMFARRMPLQSRAVLGVVQPLYDVLSRLVSHFGVGEVGVLSGSGGAELMGFVGDIWRASRGEIPIERLIRDHGFHGPLEGELAGRVWREDPGLLHALLKDYAARDDSLDPLRMEKQRQHQRAVMAREVAAAAPRWQRPAIRAVLRLAAWGIPLRGAAKRSFLQGLDVARAAARRAGEHLVADGVLSEADDVFYLTYDELTGTIPADVKELTRRRRERRAQYEQIGVPSAWKGMPAYAKRGGTAHGDAETIVGIGVSAGVAEGIARVILDPDFTDIEPGDVLVSPTTNPSWASVMFVSAALVVDVGSTMSHAAIVARELGIPCVVSTATGSETIRTGDRVRVDGVAGTVQILERAVATTEA
jgi:pyruvate,water dikinase